MGRSKPAYMQQRLTSRQLIDREAMAKFIARVDQNLDHTPSESNHQVAHILRTYGNEALIRMWNKAVRISNDDSPEDESSPMVAMSPWGRLSMHHSAGYVTVTVALRSTECEMLSTTIHVINQTVAGAYADLAQQLRIVADQASAAADEISAMVPERES